MVVVGVEKGNGGKLAACVDIGVVVGVDVDVGVKRNGERSEKAGVRVCSLSSPSSSIRIETSEGEGRREIGLVIFILSYSSVLSLAIGQSVDVGVEAI